MSTAITGALAGLDGFVTALERFGAFPQVEDGIVVYTVVPVTGALASRRVRTGVAVDEVVPWPTAPPHWIHVPGEIAFLSTNAGPSPQDGWRAHSRDIPSWGTAAEPIAAWLAHVRGVLGEAT